ncbi:hypothetical protein KKF84_04495 [Myxococcota bacterium]|nr:hypothetical protein [Myxococcota bacterium]
MEPVARKFIPEKLLFDTRMVERNLRDGIISKEEYQQHLQQIQPVDSKVRRMDTQFNSLYGTDDE